MLKQAYFHRTKQKGKALSHIFCIARVLHVNSASYDGNNKTAVF